jgi:uncharacterized membrane protein YeaQ/YmgE (transglycosylase-associated protein family)
MYLLWFIFIGLAAGWLAGKLVRGGGYGIIGDIVVGLIGSVIGGYLFRSLGVYPAYGFIGSVIVATIGAIIFIFLLRLIKRV